MHAKLHGSAKLEANGLVVDGTSYASTAPLARDLLEKTLEVRVRLKSFEQRGGGAISLQTEGAEVFYRNVELQPITEIPSAFREQ